ncbi:MAG: DUF4838 domain-containing protein [Verrucomicrobia bacterium]|nr:DUF4838 domain-containing protein [Verrucomicrobiota bacterium]
MSAGMLRMMVLLGALGAGATAMAVEHTLAVDGQPRATIVTAKNPTPSARLASYELRYHIARISGAVLPIVSDGEKVVGPCLYVGESTATRDLGLHVADLKPQEYLIRFIPQGIVLLGRDWRDTPENRAEAGRGTNWETTLAGWRQVIDYSAATGDRSGKDRIELPGIFDEQGTCYAAYDFLERCCGVRWYGPTELNIVIPSKPTLAVQGDEVRRAPAFAYRDGIGDGYPMVKAQWNNPTPDQRNLYWRRLRVGGEKWAGNHSFRSFQDRFLRKNPDHPELFEKERPDFFAQGRTGGPNERQLCFSNPDLVAQVAQDARDFFDGKVLKGYQVALGDYFALIPSDNNRSCMCERCLALLQRDRNNRKGRFFGNGTATHYWFGFVNAVAREVAKTHPGKYLSTLAYDVYSFAPEDFTLELNVAVAPCLQTRNYWAPRIKAHEHAFYEKWVAQDRPIYVWNYYNFPEMWTLDGKWRCFPGFSAHMLAEEIKMYHADHVRGVFLCGIGEQVDYYLTLKLYDDPTRNVDELLNEFFTNYFGAAAEPMARFYSLIESTYSNPENYPVEVRTVDAQYHQDERIAWEFLGTEPRMTALGLLIAEAEKRAATDPERKRVLTWKEGVWDSMVKGRADYYAKKAK